MNGDISTAPHFRSCRVVKRVPDEEYGFNLHAEKNKGQFIGKVDPGSPADRAGLQQGDRIVAVNDVLITTLTHKEVVARIKSNPLETTLLVIDEDGLKWYTDRSIPITLSVPTTHLPSSRQPSVDAVVIADSQIRRESETSNSHHSQRSHHSSAVVEHVTFHDATPPPAAHIEVQERIEQPRPRPRRCLLLKQSSDDEFGFNLHAERGLGHFVGSVDRDSIAERAGLEAGQRIVGVNGTLIYPDTAHKEVVTLIRMYNMRTELLVVSPEIDEFYRKKGLEFSFGFVEDVEPTPLPRSAHASHYTVPTHVTTPPLIKYEAELELDEDKEAHVSPPYNLESSAPRPLVGASALHHHDAPPTSVHYDDEYDDRSPTPPRSATPPPAMAQSSKSAAVPPPQAVNGFAAQNGHHHLRNGGDHRPSPPAGASPAPPQPGLEALYTMSAAEMREKLAKQRGQNKRDVKKNEHTSFEQKHAVLKNL